MALALLARVYWLLKKVALLKLKVYDVDVDVERRSLVPDCVPWTLVRLALRNYKGQDGTLCAIAAKIRLGDDVDVNQRMQATQWAESLRQSQEFPF